MREGEKDSRVKFQGKTFLFIHNASPIKRMLIEEFQVKYRRGGQKIQETEKEFNLSLGDYQDIWLYCSREDISDKQGGLTLSLNVKGWFENHLQEYHQGIHVKSF